MSEAVLETTSHYKPLHYKPFLNSQEQIEHLISKGVKFERITVEEAEEYLRNNNNYFKLRAYRKNFPKYQSGNRIGEYVNLDFAALKDLAIIDMRLRYIVIQLCLDIEHFAKVDLLRSATENAEDGYQIVTDYFSHLRNIDLEKGSNTCNILKQELIRNKSNPYCGGIIRKYEEAYPIWAFVEVIPLGSLICFYSFCAQRFSNKTMINISYLLSTIKGLRNAAAHNNCILYDMRARDAKYKANLGMIKELNGISKGIRDKRLANERMRQIVTLLYTHSITVNSPGVKSHTSQMLHELVERMFRNQDLYRHNDHIIANFSFFEKVVDILYG